MRSKWIKIASLGLIAALALALVGVGVARAETTFTGVVTAKTADEVSVPAVYTLSVEVTEADSTTTLYLVNVSLETYDAVNIGDIITFTGTAADDPLTDGIEFDATTVEVVGVQVTGTVVECSDITGIVVIDTGTGQVSVRMPPGTSCADYPVGTEVTVGGEEDVQEVKNNFDATRGHYCTDVDSIHPMVNRLAERYGVDATKIRGWFCSGFGFGEIMLALQTGASTGMEADTYLAERGSGLGWGQIWKQDGLVQDASQALPPGLAKKGDGWTPGNGHGHNSGEGDTGTGPTDTTGTDNGAPGNSGNAPGHSSGNSGNHGNSGGDHGNSGNAPGHNK